MYVIIYHNAHAFDNACESEIIGPFSSLPDAKARLVRLVANMGDEQFKLDPDPETEQDGTYAGYFYEDLEREGRSEDLASEIWAEIVKLTPG